MAKNPARQIDKSFLSLDLAEERGLLHRDYLSHCTRWSHVVRHLNRGHLFKRAVILDVGCGKEMPLAKTMYVNKMSPLQYVGVDCNKSNIPTMLRDKKIPIRVYWDTDFMDLEPADVSYNPNPNGPEPMSQPNVLTCFEVLEHVTPRQCRAMLEHMRTLTSDDANLFISTPCYNGSAAGNHINEMTFSALGSLIEDLGYQVQGVWGTFASIADYKPELPRWTYYWADEAETPKEMDLIPLFSVLSEYYDSNLLAILFAPLFPAQSRNCLWHLTKKQETRRFPALSEIPGPWSQHPEWRRLNR